ncbi:hypothetical protein EHI8A_102430 [Entamoeba histolytica HM-1:IMSS-B]|uniref:Uncharacterized protein n=6 Tax=Entamoeba histolytica TaxID=5759 RepID=C4LZP9_ENTH1|nr:hypothetical protein EHI_038650 [Entamoeba histolytica HM-1:IMSS]EMD48944.1 Hypothetical protein EHI5A_038310 [Entamoeba histolytica KU27]EMH78152.1 hypothetical protein EHI8A_102430 [Entamoeba histolytica HM-1:IMSS-B]EMS16287.1 hypothetical protein KM1_050580 [Entamoeba histolytica HM-3:IMSS]ENY59978.1 hypothetical protein EHI7A_098620 [Entamoeba histolytica HM-1:IMSS-A]GAT94352.1 hypothetical protein CL6EHI_038650 [Entamoeba histolytica]|eukprot:XP_656863.1 hypothetical protein EHI_038650 [Entamoeba histolytica HM-1:IMSS]
MEIDLLKTLAVKESTKYHIEQIKNEFNKYEEIVKEERKNNFDIYYNDIKSLNDNDLEKRLQKIYEEKKRCVELANLSQKIIQNYKEIINIQQESIEKIKVLNLNEYSIIQRIEENVKKRHEDLIPFYQKHENFTKTLQSVDLEQIDGNELKIQLSKKDNINDKYKKDNITNEQIDEWDDVDHYYSNCQPKHQVVIDMEDSDNGISLRVNNDSSIEWEDNFINATNKIYDTQTHSYKNTLKTEENEKKPFPSLDKRIDELKQKQHKKEIKQNEMVLIEKMSSKILQKIGFKEMTVIFDTVYDGWERKSFNKHVMGKKDVMGIIFNGSKKAFGFVFHSLTIEGKWLDDEKMKIFTINLNKPIDLQFSIHEIFSRNYDGKKVIYFASEKESDENLFFQIIDVLFIRKGENGLGQLQVQQNISKYFYGLDPKELLDKMCSSLIGTFTRIIFFELDKPIN